jgi:hypothetical protein
MWAASMSVQWPDDSTEGETLIVLLLAALAGVGKRRRKGPGSK